MAYETGLRCRRVPPRGCDRSMQHNVVTISCHTRRYAVLGLAAAIVLGLYSPLLVRLAVVWWTDSYAFYVLLVPLFSIYLVWHERAELRAIPRKPWPGGFALVVVALSALMVGRQWGELTLETASLVLLIWGGVLIGWGWGVTRQLAFPLGFLALMLPFPPWAVRAVTLPLQHLAAWAGTVGLEALGIPVHQEGLFLYLPTITLQVAELCNGLKYLVTLVVFAVAFAHVTQPGLWRKVVLVVSAVPFALLANALRVIGTGALGYSLGREAITGMTHAYFGKAIYLAMLGPFVAFGFLLRGRGAKGWNKHRQGMAASDSVEVRG